MSVSPSRFCSTYWTCSTDTRFSLSPPSPNKYCGDEQIPVLSSPPTFTNTNTSGEVVLHNDAPRLFVNIYNFSVRMVLINGSAHKIWSRKGVCARSPTAAMEAFPLMTRFATSWTSLSVTRSISAQTSSVLVRRPVIIAWSKARKRWNRAMHWATTFLSSMTPKHCSSHGKRAKVNFNPKYASTGWRHFCLLLRPNALSILTTALRTRKQNYRTRAAVSIVFAIR